MAGDNKPNTQPTITPEFISESKEIINSEVEKHAGGRPTVAMDAVLLDEYNRIYHLVTVGHYTAKQIVEYFAKEGNVMSESKVHRACRWMRENYPILERRDALVDAEYATHQSIREYTREIELERLGTPIVRGNGEIVTELVDEIDPITKQVVKVSKQVKKVNKDRIDRLMKERNLQERQLMQLRGLLDRANTAIQNIAVIGDAHTEMIKKMTIFDIADEEDRNKYLEVFKKYGRAPNMAKDN